MTGGKKPDIPPTSSPAPMSQPIEEQIMAKDITKKKARKRGRSSTMFADRLNKKIFNFGNIKVGE